MAYSATFSQVVAGDQTTATIEGLRITLTITAFTGFADWNLLVNQVVDGVPTFQHVAQPDSLVNIPVSAPDPLTKFVRTNQVVVNVPTMSAATDFLNAFTGDLTRLCQKMTRLAVGGSPVYTTVSG